MSFLRILESGRIPVYSVAALSEHRPLFAYLQSDWQRHVAPPLPQKISTGRYVLLPSICVLVSVAGAGGVRVERYPIVLLGICPASAPWRSMVNDMVATLNLRRVESYFDAGASSVLDLATLSLTALNELRAIQARLDRWQRRGYHNQNMPTVPSL